MTKPHKSVPERHLRRKDAAKYVVETYNVPCSPKTLAKLACVSSEGPPFRLAGRFPLYPISGLDAWAQKKIGPLVRSTSEARTRRLTPENENPAARSSWRDQRAHRALQKAFGMHTIARQAAKSKAFPCSTGVRWLSASRKPAQGSISVAGSPFLPVTLGGPSRTRGCRHADPSPQFRPR